MTDLDGTPDRTVEGAPADPVGYAITYQGKRLLVTRLADGSEVGVYPDREKAVAAALADRA